MSYYVEEREQSLNSLHCSVVITETFNKYYSLVNDRCTI